MEEDINLFVICTMTKRFHGTGNLLLREIYAGPCAERFAKWAERVQQSRSPACPAIDIYSGGHWSVVRLLHADIAKKPEVAHFWIVSAGYGLISPADEIIPYGATFAPGQPDSISPSPSPQASAEWWRLLSQWRPPGFAAAAPRSITELISKQPNSANVLVLSPDYFRALNDDLCESLKCISDPQKLIILTSDDRALGPLVANIIKVDARLQVHLGGARSSLGVRTARAVLQKLSGQSITVDSFRDAMEELVSRHGVVQVYGREPMTDGQVEEYIGSELSVNSSVSATRLLEKLRSSGRACERKRFQKIFELAKEQRLGQLFAMNQHEV